MVNDVKKNSSSNSNIENNSNETLNVNKTIISLEYKGLLWTCALREICLTALWLPLGALILCYVTASIFQADDIHETHCRVYNVVPSISAITGISPQRYIWRICIAYHLGPRLLIGSLYYNYHKQRTSYIIDEKARKLATKLGEACYWLNLLELFALTGVTYVSNRENYFIHEKIFIVFMVASLLHMLCRARVGCISSDTVEPVRTNKLVWILFYVAIAATIGLIVCFLRHRLLCRPLVIGLLLSPTEAVPLHCQIFCRQAVVRKHHCVPVSSAALIPVKLKGKGIYHLIFLGDERSTEPVAVLPYKPKNPDWACMVVPPLHRANHTLRGTVLLWAGVTLTIKRTT